jgi:toxin ParE1/3/4
VIVTITAEAEADLEQIAICRGAEPKERARAGPRAAGEMQIMLDAPRGYPLVPRYEHLDLRRRPFGRFLIFYRVGTDAIEAIHILHGA